MNPIPNLSNYKKFYTTLKDVNILVIHTGVIPSLEILICNPFNEFKKLYGLKYTTIHFNDAIRTINSINFASYNIVIFLRCISDNSIQLMEKAKSFNKKIIYITDDDFENIDPSTIEGKRHLEYNPKKNVRILSENSDSIWIYSDWMFKKFIELNKNTKLLPPYTTIDEIIHKKTLNGNNVSRKPIKIGYASNIHNRKNLSVVLPALKRILIEYPKLVKFETFFGNSKYIIEYNALGDIQYLSNVINLDPVPGIKKFHDALLNRNWDIGIAPLQDTLFNKAKSNNKYREYGMLKIPAIYSNVEAYKSSIINNYNGLMSNNTEYDWYTTIKFLIENPEQRNYIKTNAYSDVYKKYSKEVVLQNYSDALLELL